MTNDEKTEHGKVPHDINRTVADMPTLSSSKKNNKYECLTGANNLTSTRT